MMSSNDVQRIKLKHYYFDLRALGEVSRFLLTHSRMDWEDCVVSIEDWISGRYDKDFLPAGRTGKTQLPVLSVTSDGITELLPESHDIAKWIGKRCDLLGSTSEMQTKAERIFEFCSKQWNIVDPTLNFDPIPEAAHRIPTLLESLPEMLASLSEEIQDGPYVCGTDLTYADFAVFHVLDNLCTLLGEDNVLETAAPNATLRTYYDKMYRLPAISGRMMERPLAGSGDVGRPGSIIHSTKTPSKLDFIQTAWKVKFASDKGS